MRIRNTLLILVALTVVLPMQAAADGWLKAVHGIDGRDIGARKNFPVDVAVDGACALPNFRFGEITDYIALPSGRYQVNISPSDGECGQAAVLSAEIRIRDGQYTTAVAHLDENGAPTASLFQDDQSRARARNGRLTIRHTAAAPTVDITVGAKKTTNRNVTLSGLGNGQQNVTTFFNKNYSATIYPYLGEEAVFGPVPAPVTAAVGLYVYAVGSLANGTFTLLVDAEPLEN